MYITHINSFMMMMILTTMVVGGVCGGSKSEGGRGNPLEGDGDPYGWMAVPMPPAQIAMGLIHIDWLESNCIWKGCV